MNIESGNNKTKQKLDIIAGLVVLTFLSWGCISQSPSPWNCKQAKETWQKKYQNPPNSQKVDPKMTNRDTLHICF